MPFSFGVMAALATLLLCATAYIDPTQTYTWYGEMYSEYLYGPNQGATSDFGAFLFRYYPTTKTLSYNVYTSFKHTAFGMYGPTLCYAPSTNPLNFPITVDYSQPSCQLPAIGSLVLDLGQISTPAVSTVTLSSEQEHMLFNHELFILVNSTVYPLGHVGAKIHRYSYTTDSYSNIYASFYAVFEPNDNNQFPSESASQSSSTAFAYISFDVAGLYSNAQTPVPTTPITMSARFFTDVQNPGALVLTCPHIQGTITFTANAQQAQFINNVAFTGADHQLVSELFISGNCYFTLVSGTFPNGELFGYVYKMSNYELVATGNNEVTNPQTNNFVGCLVDFDLPSRMIGAICYTNSTVTVTNVALKVGAAGAVGTTTLCTFLPQNLTTTNLLIMPVRFFCEINSTYVNSLLNQDIYLQVDTKNHPGGSVRAQIMPTVTSTSSASSGLSTGGKIAIGVIFAIVGVALLGAAGFFAYKKFGGSGRI